MQIAIIGPGLIGHSVALAVRRADPSARVVEIDRGDPLDAAGGADVILLAAPVDAILETIRRHAGVLRAPLVIDTGSTKRAIVSAARDAGLRTFVGGHPMAGGASTGPSAARADLFDGRPWFLVPYGADQGAARRARHFVMQLGAEPVLMGDDGTQHDRAMAAVSHFPQLTASALMAVAARAAGADLKWAGSGLRDTTRLADSSGEVWQSILHTNGDFVVPHLRALATELNTLADRLHDGQSVRTLFDEARRARALL
jgi:prephenate dehydrogenase